MFPDLLALYTDLSFPFGVLLTPVFDYLASSDLGDLLLFTAFALLIDLLDITELDDLEEFGDLYPFTDFN